MSVPTWRRTASRLDAQFEATKLQGIILYMIGNFGIKRKPYKSMTSKETREKYPELKSYFERIDRYQDEVEKKRLLQEYDDWFVEKTRNGLYDAAEELVTAIAKANEIKCSVEREYIKRILLEDDAICAIADIRQKVLVIEERMNIDLNRYMNYAEQMEKTEHYLFEWKKSTLRDYDEFLHPEKKKERLQKQIAKKKVVHK